MIAINDNNKRMVFTHGAVPLLIQLADEYKFVQEQRGRCISITEVLRNFYSASSLKQQSADRHVASLSL
jgi:hypothetical protein